MKRLKRLVKASDSASQSASQTTSPVPDAAEGESPERADDVSDGGAASSACQRSAAYSDLAAASQVQRRLSGGFGKVQG